MIVSPNQTLIHLYHPRIKHTSYHHHDVNIGLIMQYLVALILASSTFEIAGGQYVGHSYTSVPSTLPINLITLDLSQNSIDSIATTDFSGLTLLNVLKINSNLLTIFPYLEHVVGMYRHLNCLIERAHACMYIDA